MKNFIILILYLITLSISYDPALVTDPVEKYGTKRFNKFGSESKQIALDVSGIKYGEKIYITYSSPDNFEIYLNYSWSKANYKNNTFIISGNSRHTNVGYSQTNINGNQVFSSYYSVTKEDDSYNTLIITLKNAKYVVYDYLEIQHSKDNPLNTIFITIIYIVLILFFIGICICICCIIQCTKRKYRPNQLANQNIILYPNMNNNNNIMIPMTNQYNIQTNNMYNQNNNQTNNMYNQYNNQTNNMYNQNNIPANNMYNQYNNPANNMYNQYNK